MIKKILDALSGIKEVFKTEANIRVHALIAISVLASFCYLGITTVEFLLIFSAIFLVLISEMFNTALEKLCDYMTVNYDYKIKFIKDVSVGATLLSAVYSIIVGAFILLERIR